LRVGRRIENLTAWIMLCSVRNAEDDPGAGRRSDSGEGHGRRVLLTGATGFIGSHTVAPLLQAGYEVHALGRRTGDSTDVSWHQVDLLDEDAAAAVVRELAAEHLLHLAWYAEHGSFWSSPENLSWVAASLRLLRAFHEAGGRRAVMAGTCAEYDWSEAADACRELAQRSGPATPERPATLYGAAKQATRMVASAYAREVGLSLAWGRIFLLYGPGEDERRLVAHVIRALLDGSEAQTSDGTQVRDFLHVTDVAAGFAALLDSPVEGAVNIASGEGVAIARVLALIGEEAGRPDLLRVGALPQRAGEPPRLVADTQRLRDEVGFTPRLSLRDGIADTVAWWRGRRERA
jgi:nucleoside-diphosphate-sugar epimerase